MRWMTGLSDIGRRVIGVRKTQVTRVQSTLNDRAWQIILATSLGFISLKGRGFKVRWMTWRAVCNICQALPTRCC